MPTKVVINGCYGGFELSEKAQKRYIELSGQTESFYEMKRHCPYLVQVVEELGKEANARFSSLYIVEIRGNKYMIEEYDGVENVVEPDDIQWIIV